MAVAYQTRCDSIEPGVFGKVVCVWFRNCSKQFATPLLASIVIGVLRGCSHRALTIRTPAMTDVAASKVSIKKRATRDFGPSLCSPLFYFDCGFLKDEIIVHTKRNVDLRICRARGYRY